MGHIFISYSHKDAAYVHSLREKLIFEGYEVWIDDRIDYGDEWPMVIQEHLDTCDAFILIATESAYKSRWVQKEVTRAQRINKPFFPLLLSGGPWLSIESTQYVDIRDKSLPPKKFYQRLARVSPRRITPILQSELKIKPIAKVVPKSSGNTRSRVESKPVSINAEKGNSVNTNELRKTSLGEKIATSLKPVYNRFKKPDRKQLFFLGIAVLLFFTIISVQARKWQNRFTVRNPTALAQATSQQATIQVGLTQNFERQAQTLTAAWTALPPTNTPVVAQATFTLSPTSHPATATVRAAFTQLALATSGLSPIRAATQTVTPSPTATFTKSNATLVLDNNYSCREFPAEASNIVVPLVRSLELPIYGKSEDGNWWLVQVQFADFETGYCWINGGTVEGDSESIQVVRP